MQDRNEVVYVTNAVPVPAIATLIQEDASHISINNMTKPTTLLCVFVGSVINTVVSLVVGRFMLGESIDSDIVKPSILGGMLVSLITLRGVYITAQMMMVDRAEPMTDLTFSGSLVKHADNIVYVTAGTALGELVLSRRAINPSIATAVGCISMKASYALISRGVNFFQSLNSLGAENPDVHIARHQHTT